MISVTGATKHYLLQPVLLQKHRVTLEWLSSSILWKSELIFFQKVLDERAPSFTQIEDKKRIDHFQNMIIYYQGEVIDELRSKLRGHERRLASILENKDEVHTGYFLEHDNLMMELESFAKNFKTLKNEFFEFVEKGR